MRALARLAGLAALIATEAGAGGDVACDCARAAQRAACLEWPTDRYGHGVLGPRGEWAQLSYWFTGAAPGCDPVFGLGMITLPGEAVFEDLRPRIVDLDGAGEPEVVIVEADPESGATIAVYGRREGRFGRIAATPTIGRRHRWRAVAGIADFDGDGRPEIAEVTTPHIGGTLRIWDLAGDRLDEIASAGGLSNHRIGAAIVLSAVRHCAGRAELVLPDDGWAGLRAARLSGGSVEIRALGLPATQSGLAEALRCEGG